MSSSSPSKPEQDHDIQQKVRAFRFSDRDRSEPPLSEEEYLEDLPPDSSTDDTNTG